MTQDLKIGPIYLSDAVGHAPFYLNEILKEYGWKQYFGNNDYVWLWDHPESNLIIWAKVDMVDDQENYNEIINTIDTYERIAVTDKNPQAT